MLEEYYAIIGEDSNGNTYYASNAEPLLWTDNKSLIKKFISYNSAKTALDDEVFTIKELLKYSKFKDFYIIKIEINKETERSKYNVTN